MDRVQDVNSDKLNFLLTFMWSKRWPFIEVSGFVLFVNILYAFEDEQE